MRSHPIRFNISVMSYKKLKWVGSCESDYSGRRLRHQHWGGNAMSLGTILIIILILILLGVFPTWGHSRGWGYGPSGIVGLILIVVIILALVGRL
jgi:Protein of unknown function (DUF3309)